MKNNDIKVGETYFFVATDSPARKHLEGTPFEVVEIKPVWRRLNKTSRRVKRFFDADGNGARADELEPMEGQIMVPENHDVKESPDDLPF